MGYIVISAGAEKTLHIGKQGENKVTRIDFSAFFEECKALFGTGTLALAHERQEDSGPYLVALTDGLYWDVSSADVEKPGTGWAELSYTVSNQVKKSLRWKTCTLSALGQTVTPPAAWQSYIDQVTAQVGHVTGMTVSAEAASGTTPTVTKGTDAQGNVHLTFSLVKGDKGDPGVYIGSGDMPANCNVQIDPDGTPLDVHDDIDDLRIVSRLAMGLDAEVSVRDRLTLTGAIESDKIVDGVPTNPNAGKYKANDNYIYSRYIPVLKDWRIECRGIKCATAYNVLSFYTERDEAHYVKGVAGLSAAATYGVNATFKCTQDGYIRLCSRGGEYFTDADFVVQSTVYQKIGGIDDNEVAKYVGEATSALCARNSVHKCLNFALITDTHMYPESNNFGCEKSVKLFSEIANFADFAVHCGDVAESGNMTRTGHTTDTYVSKTENWKNACRFLTLASGIKVPLYVCHGNHDVSRYDSSVPGTNAVTAAEWHRLFAPLTGNVVRNTDDSSGNYYYVDYETFKCRVIVVDYYSSLDDGGYPRTNQGCNTVERAWLNNVALDETGKTGWLFLIFNHAEQISQLAAKIASIRRNQANSVVLIHGNNHEDTFTNEEFLKSANTETYGDAKFCDIGVDNAFVKSWLTNDKPQDPEYCVDMFSVDFEAGKIYEKRLGRGNDREFKFGPANTTEANNIVTNVVTDTVTE